MTVDVLGPIADLLERVDALATGLADVSTRLQRIERGIHAMLVYTVVPVAADEK